MSIKEKTNRVLAHVKYSAPGLMFLINLPHDCFLLSPISYSNVMWLSSFVSNWFHHKIVNEKTSWIWNLTSINDKSVLWFFFSYSYYWETLWRMWWEVVGFPGTALWLDPIRNSINQASLSRHSVFRNDCFLPLIIEIIINLTSF